MTGTRFRLVVRAAAVALVALVALVARSAPARAAAPADEFFIISSVDAAKGQLLLKRPTEVTDVMRVDAATRCVDEQGGTIRFSDLRAGDTVFIRSKAGTGGRIALEIRKGPMTREELRRRYLEPK